MPELVVSAPPPPLAEAGRWSVTVDQLAAGFGEPVLLPAGTHQVELVGRVDRPPHVAELTVRIDLDVLADGRTTLCWPAVR